MGLQSVLELGLQTWFGYIAILLLVAVGSIEGFKAIYRLASGVYVYFLRPGKSLKRLGSWAIVTGATDGIGLAYSKALAKKGLNVLLISRTQAKLDEAAADIHFKYKVQAKTVAIDFSAADAAAWERVKAKVEPLEVGVLVNNVGMSYPHAEYYDAIDDKLIEDLITMNIVSTNKMTRLVLPGMKQRRRGAIVNIGSAVATIAPAGPLYAVYAGTKMYVDMFSKSLDLEYRGAGITVQNQAPGFVATKLSKIRKASMEVPSPDTWAAAAVRHIGYESTSSPYWFHALQWAIVSSAPAAIVDFYMLTLNKGLRGKYYAKLKREAAKAAGNGHAGAKDKGQ
ncbi:hypothetical protein WJX81_002026 [Elliptochloris bilobata]|uniref:Uncharacterized protein n=1 Tax=Elliptochloris bilobata TaxID=381761 RepID=A0AAW1QMM1_9CHLO